MGETVEITEEKWNDLIQEVAKCFLCKWIVEDVEANGKLTDYQFPRSGKINHLRLEGFTSHEEERKSPSDPLVFFFNDSELEKISLMASERNDPRKNSKKIDDNKTDHWVNVVGLMGEFAVSRFLSVKVTQLEGPVGDGRVSDFQIGNKTIQVKLNTWSFGDFYFNEHDEMKADIGILCVPEKPNGVRIIGWITKEKFTANMRVKVYKGKYGSVKAVPQSLLEPMVSLKEIL